MDATAAGSQGLVVNGNAVFGDVGANQALAALSVSGSSVLGGGTTVTTTGAQRYAGAVTAAGDATLSSSRGSLVFGSTVDGPLGNTLTLRADTGDVDVTGALRVGNLEQTVGGVSRFRNTVSAQGSIQLTARSFTFGNALTANKGAIALANSDNAGLVNFAAGANVQAATGFRQTGGSMVYLPTRVSVTQGPISLDASASLPAGQASIETAGDISFSGLIGTDTALTMNGGRAGKLTVGLNDASTDNKLNVRSLAVQTAASAAMYGAIGGQSGAQAASLVTSPLVNAPYFINDTPWGPVNETPSGPIDRIPTVAAIMTPKISLPGRQGVSSLFSRQVSPQSVALDAISAFRDPSVLNVLNESSPQ